MTKFGVEKIFFNWKKNTKSLMFPSLQRHNYVELGVGEKFLSQKSDMA